MKMKNYIITTKNKNTGLVAAIREDAMCYSGVYLRDRIRRINSHIIIVVIDDSPGQPLDGEIGAVSAAAYQQDPFYGTDYGVTVSDAVTGEVVPRHPCLDDPDGDWDTYQIPNFPYPAKAQVSS
jgi:hypothetical protein